MWGYRVLEKCFGRAHSAVRPGIPPTLSPHGLNSVFLFTANPRSSNIWDGEGWSTKDSMALKSMSLKLRLKEKFRCFQGEGRLWEPRAGHFHGGRASSMLSIPWDCSSSGASQGFCTPRVEPTVFPQLPYPAVLTFHFPWCHQLLNLGSLIPS